MFSIIRLREKLRNKRPLESSTLLYNDSTTCGIGEKGHFRRARILYMYVDQADANNIFVRSQIVSASGSAGSVLFFFSGAFVRSIPCVDMPCSCQREAREIHRKRPDQLPSHESAHMVEPTNSQQTSCETATVLTFFTCRHDAVFLKLQPAQRMVVDAF